MPGQDTDQRTTAENPSERPDTTDIPVATQWAREEVTKE
jgi:hypothetical protein